MLVYNSAPATEARGVFLSRGEVPIPNSSRRLMSFSWMGSICSKGPSAKAGYCMLGLGFSGASPPGQTRLNVLPITFLCVMCCPQRAPVINQWRLIPGGGESYNSNC